MARERMITRTVSATVFTVMVVKLETKTVDDIEITVSSACTMSEKDVEKTIIKAIPDGYAFVTVTGKRDTETLYGMSEEDFMKYAKVLPPRAKTE